MSDNLTNDVWQDRLAYISDLPDYIVCPRGMEVKEIVGSSYVVPMPAYIDLIDRKVNISFMFAEAAWILSGSNRLNDITDYMKVYERFSDDGKFLKGAYGPKVIEQLPYVVESLFKDNDSRQAVMTIWRERPGDSRDVPCTVSAQFLIRDNCLQAIFTMRSNDVVLGYTYDVFTFSMIANAVRLLLKERGLNIDLGWLTVQAGSLHIYEQHYNSVNDWVNSHDRDLSISRRVKEVMKAQTYEGLIDELKNQAHDAKFYPDMEVRK